MKFTKLSDFSISTGTSYIEAFERVKAAIVEKTWRVTGENMSNGTLEGIGKYYLDKFDIFVNFRTVADQQIQIDFACEFPNSSDLWKSGEKKCKELIEAVVKGNWVIPSMPPPLAMPPVAMQLNDFQKAVANAVATPINAPAPSASFGINKPATEHQSNSAPVQGPQSQGQSMMDYMTGGKGLIWLVGGSSALVFLATFFLFGSSDTSECKKEAHRDIVNANRMGGAAEYVKLCVKMKKWERDIEATRRKP